MTVVDQKTFYVLVIENSEEDFQMMRRELNKRDFKVKCFLVDSVSSMEEALEIRSWDLFIAQSSSPDFCNSQILTLWRREGRGVPFIVVTDDIERDLTLKLIDCGVCDVVAKENLNSLVPAMERWLANHAIQEEFQEKIKLFDDTLMLMQEALFKLQTLNDARKLADQLALICPEPEKRVFGLRELIVNAIEHGNLGITYADKTVLNEKNIWDKEVERRLALPENADKYVVVKIERTEDEIRFLIKDQGKGFDWKSIIDADPFGSYKSHGYGIAMAKSGSFDRLEYIGSGNEVLAVVLLD
ncbi:MAG: ATP-binding protein [Magnetococcales bacterium]|nr:ATP-binding protein [Magnetococcales bacterium]